MVFSQATKGTIRASRENPKGRNYPSLDPCFRHLAAPCLYPRENRCSVVCGSSLI
jgi:hypothetical protein